MLMAELLNKSKRKISVESPKDGQKSLKLNKMATSPCQEFTEGEHEGDIITSLHIIMSEIKDLKVGQQEMTRQITQQIDTRINDLRLELKAEINTKIDHSETYFKNECLLLNNTIGRLNAKIEKQAQEIDHLKACATTKETDPLSNHDLTVIVSGLPVYPNEDPMISAQNVIDNLGNDHHNIPIRTQVQVVKAKRLPNRIASRPPLMKISVGSLDQKKLILSHKKNLQQTPFRNLYIRSSKSHEERLIELNARTILEHSPWGKDFRISGSGRIISKQHDPKFTGELPRYEQDFPRLNQSTQCPNPHQSSAPSMPSAKVTATHDANLPRYNSQSTVASSMPSAPNTTSYSNPPRHSP